MLPHRSTATRVEQEVGRVGGGRGLIGDWAMSKRHADNGGHVSLCAEHVDGNSSGLSYKHIIISSSKYQHDNNNNNNYYCYNKVSEMLAVFKLLMEMKPLRTHAALLPSTYPLLPSP